MTSDKKLLEHTSDSPLSHTRLQETLDRSTPRSTPPPYRDLEEPQLSLDNSSPPQARRYSPRAMFLRFVIAALATFILIKFVTIIRSRFVPCHQRHNQPSDLPAWTTAPPRTWTGEPPVEQADPNQPAIIDDSTPPPEYTAVEVPNLEYRRHETTESITGTYDFYNLIEIGTVTGSIDITIRPQNSKYTGKRAVLRLRSVTGSITVRLDDQFLSGVQGIMAVKGAAMPVLDRIWDTEIRTATGSITAQHIIGGGGPTTIRTATGTMDLDLYGVYMGPNDPTTILETVSQTGTQNVKVSALSNDGDGNGSKVISRLRGRHTDHGSQALDIKYPREWQGDLEMVLHGRGIIDAEGPGLRIDERDSSHLRAHRGVGDSDVLITGNGSGTLTFSC